MNLQTKEAVLSIYNWTAKEFQSARKVRGVEKNSHKQLMLSGKIAGYKDVLERMRNRYKGKIELPNYKL